MNVAQPAKKKYLKADSFRIQVSDDKLDGALAQEFADSVLKALPNLVLREIEIELKVERDGNLHDIINWVMDNGIEHVRIVPLDGDQEGPFEIIGKRGTAEMHSMNFDRVEGDLMTHMFQLKFTSLKMTKIVRPISVSGMRSTGPRLVSHRQSDRE